MLLFNGNRRVGGGAWDSQHDGGILHTSIHIFNKQLLDMFPTPVGDNYPSQLTLCIKSPTTDLTLTWGNPAYQQLQLYDSCCKWHGVAVTSLITKFLSTHHTNDPAFR